MSAKSYNTTNILSTEPCGLNSVCGGEFGRSYITHKEVNTLEKQIHRYASSDVKKYRMFIGFVHDVLYRMLLYVFPYTMFLYNMLPYRMFFTGYFLTGCFLIGCSLQDVL